MPTEQSTGPLAEAAPQSLLVAIPCLNEEPHLEALLATLLADPAAQGARIVVIDGGSQDCSAEIVRRVAAANPRVALLHNPKRIQSAAINLAVRQFPGARYLIRVDAHARYPSDYLTQLITACEQSGAAAVAVSMRAETSGDSCFQRANAAAQNSILGTGGSAHRSGGERKWVDHGHHALFRMNAFSSAGGYDETFTHNEDAELDARIIVGGGRILLAADILIGYFPRASARALWRQYFGFGKGRARMLARHRKLPKLRQSAPLAVAPAAMMALAAPLWPWATLPGATWLALCLGFGFALGIKARDLCAAGAGFPAALMHLAWSSGFWVEAASMLVRAAILQSNASANRADS